MRIGILGGAFDPIHNGHLALANAARTELELDRVLFIPVFKHPLETKQDIVASPEARLHMVQLAIQGERRYEVSGCEIKRRDISYTVDTLRELNQHYPPPHELYFITGGDWGKRLDEWKEIGEIFSLAHFVVASRPGHDVSCLPKQVQALKFVPLEIASTTIRDEIKKGNSVASMVPESVARYLEAHSFYRSPVNG